MEATATMDAAAVEHAGELLFDQVYVPSFMQKCSARGVTFQNEDELRMALQSTNMLREKEAREASETNGNLHKAAHAALRGMLGEDVEAAEKAAQDDSEATRIGQHLTQDEGVRNAASLLSQLQAAE